jgi:hypothetical protein
VQQCTCNARPSCLTLRRLRAGDGDLRASIARGTAAGRTPAPAQQHTCHKQRWQCDGMYIRKSLEQKAILAICCCKHPVENICEIIDAFTVRWNTPAGNTKIEMSKSPIYWLGMLDHNIYRQIRGRTRISSAEGTSPRMPGHRHRSSGTRTAF